MIVKICAPESSSTCTGISGCRSHERCIITIGHSPILGSLGGRLLEDSLESRFLLLELILLLEWLSCSFPRVQVNFLSCNIWKLDFCFEILSLLRLQIFKWIHISGHRRACAFRVFNPPQYVCDFWKKQTSFSKNKNA